MGPISALSCSGRVIRVFVLGVTALSVSPGCDEKPQVEPPTKPWRRDDARGAEVPTNVRTRFEVTPDTKLEFSLPTRRSKPSGTLSTVGGHVDVDLKDLTKSSGRIVVALDSLQMENLPTPTKTSSRGDALELYTDATGEALRWLGLGSGVAQATRAAHSSATFAFDSLRGLNHPSAKAGALKHSTEGGSTRQVLATVEGDLSLRGFSVRRNFATILHFHFPDSQDESPDSVRVSLKGSAVIPLSEYEIAPRGPDGSLDTRKNAILGEQVGRDIHVTGTIHLKRASGERSSP